MEGGIYKLAKSQFSLLDEDVERGWQKHRVRTLTGEGIIPVRPALTQHREVGCLLIDEISVNSPKMTRSHLWEG